MYCHRHDARLVVVLTIYLFMVAAIRESRPPTLYVAFLVGVNCCNQTSDFKAKMHHIVCRLGFCPRLCRGAYRLPQIP